MNHLQINNKILSNLFCVWADEGDLSWIKRNYHRFSWHFENHIEKESLKIKICAIANMYYEFCHETYGFRTDIPDDIVEVFEDNGMPFSPVSIGQLIGKELIFNTDEIDENFNEFEFSLLSSAVVRAIRQFPNQRIFNELYTNRNYNPDSLFESLVSIQPNINNSYAGSRYLLEWGGSYSNYL